MTKPFRILITILVVLASTFLVKAKRMQTAEIEAAANGLNVEWVKLFGTQEVETIHDMTVDGGNIFLTGSTSGELGSFNGGQLDFWLANYSTSGAQQWVVQEPLGGFQGGQGVVTRGGNVYPAGYDSGQSWIAEYSSAGSQLFALPITTNISGESGAADVAVAGGTFYVGGWTTGDINPSGHFGNQDYWITSIDAESGERLATAQGATDVDETVEALAVDAEGNVYATGSSDEPESRSKRIWVAKFNSALELEWEQIITPVKSERGRDIIVINGSVYVASPSHLIQLDTNGNIQWQTDLTEEQIGAIDVDGSTLYVTGGKSGKIWVAEFSLGGNLLNEGLFIDGSGSAIDVVNGAIYVSGYAAEAWGDQPYQDSGDVFVAKVVEGDFGCPVQKSGEQQTINIKGKVAFAFRGDPTDDPSVLDTEPGRLMLIELIDADSSQIRATTGTDREGNYVFSDFSFDPEEEKSLFVRVRFEHAGKIYYFAMTNDNGDKLWVDSEPFRLPCNTSDKVVNIDIDRLSISGDLTIHPAINPDQINEIMYSFGYFYDAWKLMEDWGYEDSLDLTPLEIVIYSTDTDLADWSGPFTWFTDEQLAAAQPRIRLLVDEVDNINSIWHEFGHQVMADLYDNQMPDVKGSTNHGGYYVNTVSSADAWVEGFADFYVKLVNLNKAGEFSNPDQDFLGSEAAQTVNVNPELSFGPRMTLSTKDLPPNFLEEGRVTELEEHAVFALLWDLIDGKSEQDRRKFENHPVEFQDLIQLDPQSEVWFYLMNFQTKQSTSPFAPSDFHYIFDIKDLYDTLHLELGSTASVDSDNDGFGDLDELFIQHGFYVDSNNNLEYDNGEEIGRPADGDVPERRKLNPFHDGNKGNSYFEYIAIDPRDGEDTQVDALHFNIQFPEEDSYYNYNFHVEIKDLEQSEAYFMGPPPYMDADVTVTGYFKGVASCNQLSFTNSDYWIHIADPVDDHFADITFEIPNSERDPVNRSGSLFLPMIRVIESNRTTQSNGTIPRSDCPDNSSGMPARSTRS